MEVKHLAIELLPKQYETLELLCMFENTDASTIINRAIEVYKLVTDAQDIRLDGSKILFDRGD